MSSSQGRSNMAVDRDSGRRMVGVRNQDLGTLQRRSENKAIFLDDNIDQWFGINKELSDRWHKNPHRDRNVSQCTADLIMEECGVAQRAIRRARAHIEQTKIDKAVNDRLREQQQQQRRQTYTASASSSSGNYWRRSDSWHNTGRDDSNHVNGLLALEDEFHDADDAHE